MKQELTDIYHALLLVENPEQHPLIIKMLNLLQKNFTNDDQLTTTYKATLKTLIKLFNFSSVINYLETQPDFDP